MIEHLSVRDFALIESAEFDLPDGLVLFTGETGAGKSLVVGAISFLFGGRADSGTIREGADECVVSAVLNVGSNAPALAWLKEREIPDEEGRVTIRRGMKLNGRSYAYIQNAGVSKADLAAFTALLADIHGQHEHQSLLDEANHLLFLDTFADIGPLLEEYRASYEQWTTALKEYRRRSAEAEKHAREREFLRFTVKEIQDLKIKAHEDDELALEERILSQHGKLFDALTSLAATFTGTGQEGAGVITAIRKAILDIDSAQKIDPSLADFKQRLETAFFDLEDLSGGIGSYREGLRFDPGRLEIIESRLAELRKIKKKYGPSLDDVIERGRSDSKSLQESESWDEEKESLERENNRLGLMVLKHAETLSERRKTAGKALSGQVERILKRLGMANALMPVVIEKRVSEAGKVLLNNTGMDDIRFLIAPNIGESPKPLVKIASGGELSRIALAIKAVLSANDTVDTLIFDEIDTGIGGEVAVAVGIYLKSISRFRQVLCVTHLATIAVQASAHYKVDKMVAGNRTVTTIELLSGTDREIEIARMLSGKKEGDASLAHAAELLSSASVSQIVE